MNEVVPEGWAATTLGQVTAYVTSGSRDWSRYYANYGALFVRTQDINQNRLAPIEQIARVSLPDRVEGKRTRISNGDLLITITGANVGKCALVDRPIPESYVSQSVALVRLMQGLNNRFLHRQLICPSSDDQRTPLQQSAYGVGRPVLNLDNVRNAPILLAPLKEQKRIVAKIDECLSRIDSARDRLSRIPAVLKRFRQAVLAAACSGRLTQDWRETGNTVAPDRGENESSLMLGNETNLFNTSSMVIDLPTRWRWAAIQDVCETVIDYRGRTPPLSDSGIPHINTSRIRNGSIDWHTDRFVSPDTYDRYMTRGIPRSGDVLFTMEAPLGQAAVVEGSRKFSLAQRILLLRPDQQQLWGSYFMWALTCPQVRAAIEQRATGSTVKGIAFKRLRFVEIPIPPLQEQLEIVNRITHYLSFCDNIGRAIDIAAARINTLTPSILAKAFRGELVPTEADLARREGRDYEPASVLLERIKKHRESETRTTKDPRPRASRKQGAKA